MQEIFTPKHEARLDRIAALKAEIERAQQEVRLEEREVATVASRFCEDLLASIEAHENAIGLWGACSMLQSGIEPRLLDASSINASWAASMRKMADMQMAQASFLSRAADAGFDVSDVVRGTPDEKALSSIYLHCFAMPHLGLTIRAIAKDEESWGYESAVARRLIDAGITEED
ncbi:MAG TPA: hypothetical protein VNM48_06485, partial [Chloroflexota bacterium]|nr:hypothetical protein [Chloroflexota bacterium]